jgi:hypothetical protein
MICHLLFNAAAGARLGWGSAAFAHIARWLRHLQPRAMRHVALVAAVLTCLCATPGGASPLIPGIGPGLVDQAKQQAAARVVSKALDAERPIQDSGAVAFPVVSVLPGRPFIPTGWVPLKDPRGFGATVGAFLPNRAVRRAFQTWLASRDGSVVLGPGDYTFPVKVFCMKISGRSPSAYHYRLAPLRGRLAGMIAALNVRTAAHPDLYDHADVQDLSWALQAGAKYDELGSKWQKIIDAVVPEYKPLIQKSWLELVQEDVDKVISGLDVIGAGSALGAVRADVVAIESLKDQVLALKEAPDRLADFAVPSVSGAPLSHLQPPDATPWSKLGDAAYARFITNGNFVSYGVLEVRVLPGVGRVRLPLGSLVAVPDWSLGRIAFDQPARVVAATEGLGLASTSPVIADGASWEDPGTQGLSLAPDGPGVGAPADGVNAASFFGLLPQGADFGKVSVGTDIPGAFSVGISVAVDRFGQTYFGVGVGIGPSVPGVSVSAVSGSVYTADGSQALTPGEMDAVLSGYSWGLTSGAGNAVDVSGNSSGGTIAQGWGTPQAGGSVGWSWDLNPCTGNC